MNDIFFIQALKYINKDRVSSCVFCSSNIIYHQNGIKLSSTFFTELGTNDTLTGIGGEQVKK